MLHVQSEGATGTPCCHRSTSAALGAQQQTSRMLLLQSTTHKHTHTHQFNGRLSRTTRVSRYQKGRTNLDFTEARDSEWQWHQLGHMQVFCTSLQTDNHASTPLLLHLRTPFKCRLVLPFCSVYPGVLEKRPLNRCCSSSRSSTTTI